VGFQAFSRTAVRMCTTVVAGDDDHASPRLLHAFLFVFFIPTLHTNANAQSPLNALQFIARQHGPLRSSSSIHCSVFFFEPPFDVLIPRHLSASPFRLSKAPLSWYLPFL